MGILVSNGCSFVYGDELRGSREIPPSHDGYTFTHLLSSKLDVKYKNLAGNGASNQKIFRTTTEFLQNTNQKVDYLVIIWSSWGRLELSEPFEIEGNTQINIIQETNMNQIIPSHKSTSFIWQDNNTERPTRRNIIEAYYNEVYTMQTAITHTLMYMRSIQQLCDSMGIKVVQGIIHQGMYSNLLATMKMDREDWKDYQSYVAESLAYLRPECKMGLGEYIDLYRLGSTKYTIYPGGHPDEDTQLEYAELIESIIKGL